MNPDLQALLTTMDKAFDEIVAKLMPLGTKNRAMKMKPEAVKIIMKHLDALFDGKD